MKKTNILIFILFAMILLFGCGKSEDKTNRNMESKNETVVNESLGIQQFRMTSAFDSEFELDYQNHYIMALKDVEMKGIPIDSIEPNRVLDYKLVRVHAAVYAENEKWVLVSYYTLEKLLFPVTVSVDCKDIDTGEKVDDDDWRITSIEGKIVTIRNCR